MTDSEIERIIARIDEMDAKLEPLYETYQTGSALMRWFKALLVLISIIIGTIVGFKNLLK